MIRSCQEGHPFLFVNFYISYISSRKIITQECGVLCSLMFNVCCCLYISFQYIIIIYIIIHHYYYTFTLVFVFCALIAQSVVHSPMNRKDLGSMLRSASVAQEQYSQGNPNRTVGSWELRLGVTVQLSNRSSLSSALRKWLGIPRCTADTETKPL